MADLHLSELTASVGCDWPSRLISRPKSQYASKTDHPLDFSTIDGRLQHDAWLDLRSTRVDPGEISCTQNLFGASDEKHSTMGWDSKNRR